MIEALVLVTMAVFALLLIHSNQLRLAIVFLAVFSLLAALLYVLFAAPELAIAEGVIGSGLVTLLYLAALKRNRVYTIAVACIPPRLKLEDRYMNSVEGSEALREIRSFFVQREVEMQVVFIDTPPAKALADEAFDLVLGDDGQMLTAYISEDDYVTVEMEMVLQLHGKAQAIRFLREAEGGE